MESESKCITFLQGFQFYIDKVIYPSMIKSNNPPIEEQYEATKKSLNEEVDRLIRVISENHFSDSVVFPLVSEIINDAIEKYLVIVSASVAGLPCCACSEEEPKYHLNCIPIPIANKGNKLSVGFICMDQLKRQVEENKSRYELNYNSWEFMKKDGSIFKIEMVDIIVNCYSI